MMHCLSDIGRLERCMSSQYETQHHMKQGTLIRTTHGQLSSEGQNNSSQDRAWLRSDTLSELVIISTYCSDEKDDDT